MGRLRANYGSRLLHLGTSAASLNTPRHRQAPRVVTSPAPLRASQQHISTTEIRPPWLGCLLRTSMSRILPFRVSFLADSPASRHPTTYNHAMCSWSSRLLLSPTRPLLGSVHDANDTDADLQSRNPTAHLGRRTQQQATIHYAPLRRCAVDIDVSVTPCRIIVGSSATSQPPS
jgi:hypothetical protein